MRTVTVDFSKECGKIKPMHAVNNGPLAPTVRGTSNFEQYKAAKIPYARNHDASFYSGYGGEHIVDVHRIFKNFDADENDPASYIFEPTDKYVKTTYDAGTKVFYRLGASIEHQYKYGTRVPKDSHKWARICEHIIRHYNEGWADGFEYGIEYWEIWNEPECRNADGSNPCWQGTDEEFIDLYCIAAKHLKSCFPRLKIGGPAFCAPWTDCLMRGEFLKAVKESNTPLDFYSYHRYAKTPLGIAEAAADGKKILAEYGFDGVETILNEWNYIKGWLGDEWKYSLASEQGLKGSSFIAGSMALCQYTSLDMLMYYDARPCGMNGMFMQGSPWITLKGYYPFVMFSHLYELGVAAEAVGDDAILPVAAKGKSEKAVMLSYFLDDDTSPAEEVALNLKSLGEGKKQLDFYLLDDDNDMRLVKTEYLSADEATVYLNMSLFSTYLVKISY